MYILYRYCLPQKNNIKLVSSFSSCVTKIWQISWLTYLLLVGMTPSPPVEALRSRWGLLVGDQLTGVACCLSPGAIHLSAWVMHGFNSIFELGNSSARFYFTTQIVPVSGYPYRVAVFPNVQLWSIYHNVQRVRCESCISCFRDVPNPFEYGIRFDPVFTTAYFKCLQ